MLTLILPILFSFISTKSSTVFHADNCRYAIAIVEKLDANTIDNVRIYADCNEAIAAGKRPCLICDPVNFKLLLEVPSETADIKVMPEPNNVLPKPVAITLAPIISVVCAHWLAGADCNIPSGNGDWDANKIVDLRDFALAANGDVNVLVIWGVDECDMWESNAVVNRERQCKK